MTVFGYGVGAALVAVLAAGCGSSAEPDVAAAVRDFSAAVAQGDTGAACEGLAPRVLEQWGAVGEYCEQELVAALSEVPGPPGEVQAWGEAAMVRAGADTVFLIRSGDRWLVTGAGCQSARADEPYTCEVGGP
ncbi:hypothetical protein [Actinokineospora iranica]|uniref:Uncharacterized protein n=1 Tax=Actinokineospora iranica TaxID=1271860 RepID=A0A1G6MAR5_9PSEU|nr:hypothetical protein [Actinokineospora iranica]SDC52025.1 hypothetical protein SAMN05216174_102433 [Actinokineospora iranica]